MINQLPNRGAALIEIMACRANDAVDDSPLSTTQSAPDVGMNNSL